jgi:hypothetical protein
MKILGVIVFIIFTVVVLGAFAAILLSADKMDEVDED